MADNNNEPQVPSEPEREPTQPEAVPSPDAVPASAALRTSSNTWVIWLMVGLFSVFTVLVVCGGILAALLLPAIQAARQTARRAQCEVQIGVLDVALQTYQFDTAEFPTTEQGLEVLRNPPAKLATPEKWIGPYLDTDIPVDPWGNPYQYRCPGMSNPNSYDLWSIGPDEIDGTEDDIGNWQ